MEKQDIRTHLIDIRTHLTVVNLASAQLRRRSPNTAESARLFAYLDGALTEMEHHTRSIETILEKERQSAQRPNPFRLLVGMVTASALAAAKMRRFAQGRGQRQMMQALP